MQMARAAGILLPSLCAAIPGIHHLACWTHACELHFSRAEMKWKQSGAFITPMKKRGPIASASFRIMRREPPVRRKRTLSCRRPSAVASLSSQLKRPVERRNAKNGDKGSSSFSSHSFSSLSFRMGFCSRPDRLLQARRVTRERDTGRTVCPVIAVGNTKEPRSVYRLCMRVLTQNSRGWGRNGVIGFSNAF